MRLDYKKRCEDPIGWIDEIISDIKRHRDENNPKWVRKTAVRLAEYAITLSQYAEDWEFNEELDRLYGKLPEKEEEA